MGIRAIPIEIALHIAASLEPEDLFHWALSCRQFGYLIRDNAVCRASLRTRPYSRECREAGASFEYAKALRTHVKRRAAIQKARPFSVTVLEGGNPFVYANGALCYTLGHGQMRLLDFNETQVRDWSFDIRQLLKQKITQVREAHRHRFSPLHFAEGLFSCLYSSKAQHLATPTHWLTVIDVGAREVLTFLELERIDDIWVRNTRDWLYCGISAETEDEEARSWVLFQLDAQRSQWASKRVMIQTMPHGDLGVGNCFEIFDGYLYGASSRLPVSFDSYESQAWNSFYYVFRFRLGDSDSVEVMGKKASWRRWPADGNVDDRWGSLQLVKDESLGDIYLYESRREFLESRPRSQRNCYRKRVVFPRRQPDEPSSWISRQPTDWDSDGWREEFDPDDIHHGDDWYLDTTYTVREAPIRTYMPSCRTFLDLIAQRQDCPADKPLLHIRARPRDQCRNTPSTTTEGLLPSQNGMKEEPQADHGVRIWPSKQELLVRDEQLTTLLAMLHPDTAHEVSWHADERFVMYAVAPTRGRTAGNLIIISFDPSVRLPDAGL